MDGRFRRQVGCGRRTAFRCSISMRPAAYYDRTAIKLMAIGSPASETEVRIRPLCALAEPTTINSAVERVYNVVLVCVSADGRTRVRSWKEPAMMPPRGFGSE